MVRRTIAGRDVRSEAVIRAMQTVPRHRFMPPGTWELAYSDQPVPIGLGQTISQPYIVARMTELADVGPGSRVLDVGTGSGYQAAVLAELGCDVWSVEIVEALGLRAREALDATGYGRVHTRIGDGYRGWPDAAPFDAIVVAAAPDHLPLPLIGQLRDGGRMVLPVGTAWDQELRVVTRTGDTHAIEPVCAVAFVPMTGEAQAARG
ncbi:MAG: protein-L-isoaspartate(D-aspartate) O-methyltransferase [Alphaproteobacteria bacterium]|nr:protein-L-isoaspartate(D-aspartate) O-methyltransferase [Alphaproteobacteria bacterium]